MPTFAAGRAVGRWIGRAGGLLFSVSRSIFLSALHHIFPVKEGGRMVKRLLTLLFTFVLAFPLSTVTLAQEAPAKAKAAKEARWEGTVIRSSPEKSTLTVRKVGSTVEKTVQYDS